MDQESPRLERDDKALLITAIHNSRDDVSCNFAASAEKVNFVHTARESFQRNSFKWLAGSVIFGALVVTRILPRSRTKAGSDRRSTAGWVFGKGLKGAFILAQPYLLHAIHSQVDQRINPTRTDAQN